jgi:hypothetical protein
MKQDDKAFEEWAQDLTTKEVNSAMLVTIFIASMALLIILCSCSRQSTPTKKSYGMTRVTRL